MPAEAKDPLLDLAGTTGRPVQSAHGELAQLSGVYEPDFTVEADRMPARPAVSRIVRAIRRRFARGCPAPSIRSITKHAPGADEMVLCYQWKNGKARLLYKLKLNKNDVFGFNDLFFK